MMHALTSVYFSRFPRYVSLGFPDVDTIRGGTTEQAPKATKGIGVRLKGKNNKSTPKPRTVYTPRNIKSTVAFCINDTGNTV